jgi:hypothetical protein
MPSRDHLEFCQSISPLAYEGATHGVHVTALQPLGVG